MMINELRHGSVYEKSNPERAPRALQINTRQQSYVQCPMPMSPEKLRDTMTPNTLVTRNSTIA